MTQPTDKFGGKGSFRAAKAESANADSEWLSQIYGQHTIYRRDQVILNSMHISVLVHSLSISRNYLFAC